MQLMLQAGATPTMPSYRSWDCEDALALLLLLATVLAVTLLFANTSLWQSNKPRGC
jgi:hypothetical protein